MWPQFKAKYQKIFWFLLPLGTFAIGLILPVDILPPKITTFKEIRNPGHYRFINPLLECDVGRFSNYLNHDDLKILLTDQIKNLEAKSSVSHVSLYYRDLNNGPWLGINENDLFSPASLVKVPLLITYYKVAESSPDILNTELTIGETAPQNSQNIPPPESVVPRQKYPVSELLRRMIVYSDNMAYDTLMDYIDNQQLVKTYQDLGVNLDRAFQDPNGNILSVKDYASFYRMLYNSSYLTRPDSEKILTLLSQTKFTDGLTAHLPPDMVVSHKYGERQYESTQEKQLHDCGIVYLPQKPYLICIMTRGQNFTDLKNTIQDLSLTVYNHLAHHP